MAIASCCCGINKFNNISKKEEFDENWVFELASVTSYQEVEEVVVRVITSLFKNSSNFRIHWGFELYMDKDSLTINETNMKSLSTQILVLSQKEIQSTNFEKFFLNYHNHKYSIFVPIIDDTNSNFNGYIMFYSNNWDVNNRKLLEKLSKQFNVMFTRLNKIRNQGGLNTLPTIQSQMGVLMDNCNTPLTNYINEKYDGKLLDAAILELCGNLNDKNPAPIQIKVIEFMKQWCYYEGGFILLVTETQHEFECQVVDSTILDPELRFHIHNGLLEDVIRQNKSKYFNYKDLEDGLADLVYLSQNTQYRWNDLVAVPVTKPLHLVLGLVNKLNHQNNINNNNNETPPSSSLYYVESVFSRVFHYISTIVASSLAYDTEKKLKHQTESMLQVAMNIFRKMDNLPILLKEIMSEAKKLTNAERCSVFLLEEETNELVAKVFDGMATVPINNDPSISSTPCCTFNNNELTKEVRIPLTQGIAGHVVSTGEVLNICDAYSHPLFYRGVDKETGYITRNILCFPIKDESQKVLGVAQLCNKINGPHFIEHDVNVALSFSVYCGISIVHSLMYKNVQDAQHRNRLANELMTYHMQISEENYHWLSTTDIPNGNQILSHFDSFLCLPRSINERDSLLAVLSMFSELQLPSRWRIPRTILARFTLKVRRGYRDNPPYHNWYHAFSVAHFSYVCLQQLHIRQSLTDLEVLTLFVASLCHDIDHRGTNNSFQVNNNSVLAALYSNEGSVLERHHFSQTVCILNSDGCNIFGNMTRFEYQEALDLLKDIILATDLNHHLRVLNQLQSMVTKFSQTDANVSDTLDVGTRRFMIYLLMTSADLSDQSKPWPNASMSASLLYEEFFSQGDLEKKQGQMPADQMDRSKACIPLLQIQFLDGVVEPCFKMFYKLLPDCGNIILDNIRNNKENWNIIYYDLQQGRVSDLYKPIFHNHQNDNDHTSGQSNDII